MNVASLCVFFKYATFTVRSVYRAEMHTTSWNQQIMYHMFKKIPLPWS